MLAHLHSAHRDVAEAVPVARVGRLGLPLPIDHWAAGVQTPQLDDVAADVRGDGHACHVRDLGEVVPPAPVSLLEAPDSVLPAPRSRLPTARCAERAVLAG